MTGSAQQSIRSGADRLAHTEGQADDTQNLEIMAGACLGRIGPPRLRDGQTSSRCCRRVRPGQPGAGMEPDLHRHAHCDEYRRTRPVSGSARSFTRRSSTPTTASSGATRQSSFISEPRPRRVAPSGGHRCRVHGAGRPLPVPAVGAGCQLCRFARERSSDDGGDGGRIARARASPGERRSRRPCSPGARPMVSAPPTLRSRAARRSASGGRRRRRTCDERAGVGIHRHVRPGQQQRSFNRRPPRDSGEHDVRRRFQRRQGARSQDGLDAHRRPDGARAVLGRQRQRPLESGGEPDCARQPPVDVRQQPAARGVEHRDGRHGVHHLERQAILRRDSDGGDLAAGDRDPAGGHRRQSGHGSRRRLAAARHHAVAPGISCRAPQPERRGGDRSPQPLRRQTDVHADDGRTAEPHVHQHHAGALGR